MVTSLMMSRADDVMTVMSTAVVPRARANESAMIFVLMETLLTVKDSVLP